MDVQTPLNTPVVICRSCGLVSRTHVGPWPRLRRPEGPHLRHRRPRKETTETGTKSRCEVRPDGKVNDDSQSVSTGEKGLTRGDSKGVGRCVESALKGCDTKDSFRRGTSSVGTVAQSDPVVDTWTPTRTTGRRGPHSGDTTPSTTPCPPEQKSRTGRDTPRRRNVGPRPSFLGHRSRRGGPHLENTTSVPGPLRPTRVRGV